MRRVRGLADLLPAAGWPFLLVVTALWPVLISAGTADMHPFAREVDGSSHRLQELRREIGALRGDLSRLTDDRKDADRSLAQTTREIGLIKELLAGLDQREIILTMQRDSLQADLSAKRDIYELRRRNLAARLRAIYMKGPQYDLELILTAESFSALVARMKLSAMVTHQDGRLLRQTLDQGQRLAAEQQQMQAALAGIWEAREEARQARERLELLEAERRALLREITQEESRTQEQLARLQQQAKALEDMLERLETRREEQAGDPAAPSSGFFGRRRGDLPWPASGVVVRGFGKSVHPRFGTVTMHNGIDIAVTQGAPVYSVAPGKVEFADHLPGFGRCVILDHGEGHYTLYANLARIFVNRGHQVAEGQILAEMGDNGEGGRPELYFEIRQGREARNPMDWLHPPR
jgi:murein hydrolase activator